MNDGVNMRRKRLKINKRLVDRKLNKKCFYG